jgi:tryptophan-rich sensory protein
VNSLSLFFTSGWPTESACTVNCSTSSQCLHYFSCCGLSWAIAARKSSNKKLAMCTYASTTILLGVWIVVYGCAKNKKAASWVLLLVVAAGLASFGQGNDISRVLIAPLIAWTLFALVMNTTEVQDKGKI